MLDDGNQIAVRNALNQMLEKKIVEYSSVDGDTSDNMMIGDIISLSFADENTINDKKVKSEQ